MRIRRSCTAVLGAVTVFGLVVAASPAGAAVTAATVGAASQPSIASGATNQAAGDFTVTETGGAVGIGDTITITVADSAANNCATTAGTPPAR